VARAICFLLLLLVRWTTQGFDAKKKPPLQKTRTIRDHTIR